MITVKRKKKYYEFQIHEPNLTENSSNYYLGKEKYNILTKVTKNWNLSEMTSDDLLNEEEQKNGRKFHKVTLKIVTQKFIL